MDPYTFTVEPLVDFGREENRRQMEKALELISSRLGRRYPLIIGGERIESKETFTSIQESLDFSDYEEMCSGAPAFDVPMWVHRFNTEAVRRGLLVPVDKVSQ